MHLSISFYVLPRSKFLYSYLTNIIILYFKILNTIICSLGTNQSEKCNYNLIFIYHTEFSFRLFLAMSILLSWIHKGSFHGILVKIQVGYFDLNTIVVQN